MKSNMFGRIAKRWALCAIILAPLSSLADADWGFYYQAEIRDENGKVIVDAGGYPAHSQSVTIRLYDAASYGSALWGHKYDVYCDTNGLFNVFLSDSDATIVSGGKSLADVIRSKPAGGLYISIARGSESEMLPRQRICAVPFADYAQTLAAGATALGDFAVNGDCTVNGTLSASSLDGASKPVSLPKYGIILWFKDTAPDGITWNWDTWRSYDGRWAICNGQTIDGFKLPDLRDRFVCGACGTGEYKLGNMGGASTVTLSSGELPSHVHKFSYKKDGWKIKMDLAQDIVKVAPVADFEWEGAKDWDDDKKKKYYDDNGGWKFDDNTQSAGSGNWHNNLPPYRALYYIMRIK